MWFNANVYLRIGSHKRKWAVMADVAMSELWKIVAFYLLNDHRE